MKQAPEALRDSPGQQEVSPTSAKKLDEELSTRSEGLSVQGNALANDGKEVLVRRILVPTDFSCSGAEAVERAVSLANQSHADLTVLHVIDISRVAVLGTAQDMMQNLWVESSAQMGQLARALSAKVEAQMILAEGLPWEVIVDLSRNFDLLVLGQGRGKRSWRLFSSHTSQRVIENAACPVMLVHARSSSDRM